MRVLAGSCTQNSTPFHIFSFFMKTHTGWEDYLASLEKIGLAELTEIKEAALARWNEAIQ